MSRLHPSPRRRAVVCLALVLALATSTAGCGEQQEAAAAPNRAHQWFAAYHSALRQGVFNAGRFYAADVSVDTTMFAGNRVTGRIEAITEIGTIFSAMGRTGTEELPGDVYLAEGGALQPGGFAHAQQEVPQVVASISQVGPGGIEAQAFGVSPRVWGRDWRMPALEDLVTRWSQAWQEGASSGVEDLYAPDATLVDSLAAIRAVSRTAIAEVVEQPGPRGRLPVSALEPWGAASPRLYVLGLGRSVWWRMAPIERVAVLDQTTAGRCPGAIAAVLTLEGGPGSEDPLRIVREERYHRDADLARCSGGRLPAGWWDDVPMPAPVAKEPTGAIDAGANRVATFNATPSLAALASWGLDRYAAAGLSTPRLAEVAFYSPTVDLCEGVAGLAAGGAVSLCLATAQACVDDACTDWAPWAKWTVLHELGHVWIATNTTQVEHDHFVQQAGLGSWADTDAPWGERGVEVAASALAWGLMDEPWPHPPLSGRSCDELRSLFTTLAGVAAPGSAPCPL